MVLDKTAKSNKSFISLILGLLQDVISLENGDDRFPFVKLEKFLSDLSVTKGFQDYKDSIINVTHLLHRRLKLKGRTLE